MLINRNNVSQTGFSMVELMIGIAILAILSAVAVPSFQSWLQNSQIRNAAESILNGLQRARAEAVGRNINVEFVVSPDSSWVVRVASGVEIESRSSGEGSKDVTITMIPNGTNTVTYNNFGGIQATNLDTSAPFNRIDADSSSMPTSESQDLRITIGLGGNVKLCDPNAPSGSARAC